MRTLLNRTAYFGLGILLALFLVASETKAQCPTDIPIPHADSGNTTTGWTNVTTPFVDFIQGTDCLIDIFYCERTITDRYGNFIEQQYFVYKVMFDPSNDPGACDGIDNATLIKDGINGIFQKFGAPPCNSYSKEVSVFRRSCWKMELINVGFFQIPALFGCDASPECGKTCLVCYDGYANQPRYCTYTLYGTTSDCTALTGIWSLNTCYYIPCGD